MGTLKEPSDQPPFLSKEGLGATLLTEVAAKRRPLMQIELASCLLNRLEDWPTEPALIYPSADSLTSIAAPIGGQLTVGRVSGPNQIEIPVPHLSKRHFQITRKGDVHCLVDLGSRNGTYVNGGRWDRFRFLQRGDCIQAGGVSFIFWTAHF